MAKQTPLYDTHVANKGKMVEFGGFDMPVWFSSLKDEHATVRESVGMFDISHMGLLKLSGDQAQETLQNLTCNDVSKSLSGKMVYSMMLNDNGAVLDDIMFGYLSNAFYVVVNASNKEKIINWINQHKPDSVTLEDLNQAYGFIAVQGPESVSKLSDIFQQDLNENGRFSITEQLLSNVPVIALRTGYTGEDGFEFIIPNTHVTAIWDQLLAAGITPCGLAARDTLRLEVGLPLYGQELSETITPLMTRYRWVIKWDKDFIGKEALEAKKDNEEMTTVGLELQDRAIPRTHYPIKEGGEVTSGTLSPSLNKPIAMAIVNKTHAELGTELTVEIRGKEFSAKVVEIPFK